MRISRVTYTGCSAQLWHIYGAPAQVICEVKNAEMKFKQIATRKKTIALSLVVGSMYIFAPSAVLRPQTKEIFF